MANVLRWFHEDEEFRAAADAQHPLNFDNPDALSGSIYMNLIDSDCKNCLSTRERASDAGVYGIGAPVLGLCIFAHICWLPSCLLSRAGITPELCRRRCAVAGVPPAHCGRGSPGYPEITPDITPDTTPVPVYIQGQMVGMCTNFVQLQPQLWVSDGTTLNTP